MPTAAQDERIDALARALWWIVGTVALVTAVLLFAVAWQSYKGRVDVVMSQRTRCAQVERQTRGAVAESLASYRANMIVASDPSQSAVTRRARRDQAAANLRAAEVREFSLPRSWRVTALGKRAPEFSCDGAYPSPSPWPWDQ